MSTSHTTPAQFTGACPRNARLPLAAALLSILVAVTVFTGTAGGQEAPDEDLAERLFREMSFRKAASAFEELSKWDSGNLRFQMRHAVCLFEIAERGKASEVCQSVLEISPNHVEALLLQARAQALIAAAAREDSQRLRHLNDARNALIRAARCGGRSLHALRLYEELQPQTRRPLPCVCW
ncbi:hypothetical protein ACFL59_03880, partial [Planctomycetota bacterium]